MWGPTLIKKICIIKHTPVNKLYWCLFKKLYIHSGNVRIHKEKLNYVSLLLFSIKLRKHGCITCLKLVLLNKIWKDVCIKNVYLFVYCALGWVYRTQEEQEMIQKQKLNTKEKMMEHFFFVCFSSSLKPPAFL